MDLFSLQLTFNHFQGLSFSLRWSWLLTLSDNWIKRSTVCHWGYTIFLPSIFVAYTSLGRGGSRQSEVAQTIFAPAMSTSILPKLGILGDFKGQMKYSSSMLRAGPRVSSQFHVPRKSPERKHPNKQPMPESPCKCRSSSPCPKAQQPCEGNSLQIHLSNLILSVTTKVIFFVK